MTKVDKKLVKLFIDEYKFDLSMTEIGKRNSIDSKTVSRHLKANGIKIRRTNYGAHRKYKIHEDFFDNIDTQEKAYFLGILYADGTNSIKNHSVRLWLSDKDIDLLKRLNKLIYISDKPLRRVKKKLVYIKGFKIKSARDQYELAIYSKHMANQLNKLGMVPAKSNILTFPDHLNEDLIRHFIRGYFDGDGSVFITKGNQLSIKILGTHKFCHSLAKKASKLIGIKLCILPTSAEKTFSISIHGNGKGLKFFNWIYNNSSIHMERKHNVYQKAKEIVPKRYTHCIVCGKERESFNGYCKKHYHIFWRKRKRENAKHTI